MIRGNEVRENLLGSVRYFIRLAHYYATSPGSRDGERSERAIRYAAIFARDLVSCARKGGGNERAHL